MDQHTLEIRDKILQSMMSNKQELVRRYGSEAEKVLYGRSMSAAEKQVEAEKKDKLRETIRQCLYKPTQKLLEKQHIDKQGDEWKDEDYDKDLTDYEPSQAEIEAFERDEKGIPPVQTPKKDKYTGYASLEVLIGFNKYQPIKHGKIGLINSIYDKLPNKSQYRVRKEVE